MLYLVRHGRTPANAAGLLLGRLDPDLDGQGLSQISRLTGVLPAEARVVTSPLRRARQTADALGRPVTVDDRWIELDYGDWDGLPLGEVSADDWARWRSDVHFAPPGGESLAQLGSRVREACGELLEEAAARDVVVVSHVSPIKAAVAWALGVDDGVAWNMFLAPASISQVRTGATSALVTFNDTSHLS